jgi:hypothetical protein
MNSRTGKKDATHLNMGIVCSTTTSTPGVRDHLSDREISTVLFLLANIGSKAGELPRTLTVSQDSKYSVPYKNI